MGSLTKKHQLGFTYVEIMVAIAVLAVLVVGGLSANSIATAATKINKRLSTANLLAQEGMEALLSARAANFTQLSAGDFHPVYDAIEGWTLVAGSEQIDDFTRTITLSPVMRDLVCSTTICDIVEAGGVTDEYTLTATVVVTWQESDGTKERRLSTLVTYWR